jgi:hypothetical protein
MMKTNYDRKECLKTFVRYEKRIDDSSYRVLQGFTLPNGHFKEYDTGEIMKIPEGYKKVRINRKWLETYMCPEAVDEDKLKNAGGIPDHEWIKLAKQKYGFTIRDFLALQPGQSIDLLMMDRNVLDIVESNPNKRGRLYTPHHFFKGQKARFIRSANDNLLIGKMIWSYTTEEQFEPDIEYKKNHWYPLQDGKVGSKHWSKFPKSTKIGWRGAMIPWKNVAQLPKVYYGSNPV